MKNTKNVKKNKKPSMGFLKVVAFLFLCNLFLPLPLSAQGGTTGPLTWKINNNTLTISGTGAMPDYEWGKAPWHEYQDSINTCIIEPGVTRIGNFAFSDWIALTSINISNSVTSIGERAFDNCRSLTVITIPNGVTSIEKWAFLFCMSLASINVESGNNHYASENGVLFDKSKTTLICCPAGKIGTYVIPNSVASIGEEAFLLCASLTSIDIPNSVTSIGIGAFNSCYNLTSITIPNGITRIENSVFGYCFNLTSITIPNGVTSIGSFAFEACRSLTSIAIPNSVTSIGGGAFAGCRGFTSITLPNSVTSIGKSTFYDCRNLTSISIPNNVTSIGASAFMSCESLTSITLPNSVTSIGTSAFRDCYNLTSITIPNGVTSIEDLTFEFCHSLLSVTIPNSVTNIGNSAFRGCSNLTSITNLNPVPVEIETNVFQGIPKNACTLKVPVGSVSAYQNADVWEEFNIVGIVGIETLELATVKIYPNPTTGELRITNYKLGIRGIEIFDVYGKKHECAKARMHEGEMMLDILHLATGIYIIKVITENGVSIEKIIKN